MTAAEEARRLETELARLFVRGHRLPDVGTIGQLSSCQHFTVAQILKATEYVWQLFKTNPPGHLLHAEAELAAETIPTGGPWL